VPTDHSDHGQTEYCGNLWINQSCPSKLSIFGVLGGAVIATESRRDAPLRPRAGGGITQRPWRKHNATARRQTQGEEETRKTCADDQNVGPNFAHAPAYQAITIRQSKI
jgi:hypothetical protein